MLFMTYLRYCYYVLVYYWFRFALLFGIYSPPTKLKTFLDEDQKYSEVLIQTFQNTWNSNSQSWNSNIHNILYDKTKYTLYMTESNTELEKMWRTRILFENTPRGNVIMFYDPYKLGFSFYCDQKIISYDILNAIATKYVRMFRCRDFFLDESIVPPEKKSPLIALHFEEKKKVLPPTSMKQSNKWASGPKHIQLQSKHNQQLKEGDEEPEKMKNKFIYLGKLGNFQFTQSMPKPRKVLARFVSPLLESLGEMSFKEYKEWQQKESTISL